MPHTGARPCIRGLTPSLQGFVELGLSSGHAGSFWKEACKAPAVCGTLSQQMGPSSQEMYHGSSALNSTVHRSNSPQHTSRVGVSVCSAPSMVAVKVVAVCILLPLATSRCSVPGTQLHSSRFQTCCAGQDHCPCSAGARPWTGMDGTIITAQPC